MVDYFGGNRRPHHRHSSAGWIPRRSIPASPHAQSPCVSDAIHGRSEAEASRLNALQGDGRVVYFVGACVLVPEWKTRDRRLLIRNCGPPASSACWPARSVAAYPSFGLHTINPITPPIAIPPMMSDGVPESATAIADPISTPMAARRCGRGVSATRSPCVGRGDVGRPPRREERQKRDEPDQLSDADDEPCRDRARPVGSFDRAQHCDLSHNHGNGHADHTFAAHEPPNPTR